ncbi:MAG: HAD-IIIA family hydrolase [Desulfobacterota bacterium]|nr:HAD-IIIA family hydrolase [Thermodesulfobacteriota bacterium]
MSDGVQAIIIAGGRGTRLGSLGATIPKALLPIGGIPLLEHQIVLLKRYGIHSVMVLTGHRGEQVEQFCGDGSRWGVSIVCIREDRPLGTAGAVRAVADKLSGDFIVLYGDVMVNMNVQRLIDFHRAKMSDATLVIHPNDHPFDSDLVEIDNDHRIINLYPKPHSPEQYHRNLVNAAVYVLSPRIIPFIEERDGVDFGRDVFPRAYTMIHMYGYTTREYIKDIGTPERWHEVDHDYCSGRIERALFDCKRPAVFLDRDGVINNDIGLVHRPEQFELLPYAAAGVRKLNGSEYLAVVVTNQSVVARNLCTIATLETIHNKMETLLGRERAKLDGIYYCPHHPDQGYPEENKAYKIDCDCRKPKTGLIDRAVQELNIAREDSYMIGDGASDILCGKAAGLTTIGLRCGRGCKDGLVMPDYFFENLYEAACFIVEDPYRTVYERICSARRESGKQPFVIAIGGNSRSGKSVLAQYITLSMRRNGERVVAISLDNWLLPFQQRLSVDDVFARFQMKKLEHDLKHFFDGNTVTLKAYDQRLRSSSNSLIHYQLHDATVVIIEGIVALASSYIRSIADLKIFCSIDRDLLVRRVNAFYRWKGLAEDAIMHLIASREKDEYDIIKQNCVYADMIVNPVDHLS